jgi:hypothetical protein
MNRISRPRLAAQLLLGLCLTIAATVQAAVVQQSQMLGRYVQDPAGKNVGELRDFVVDMREGRAAFALLWVPGRSGGGRFAAYPLPAKFSLENNSIKLDSGKERIDELPGFGPGEEPDFASSEFSGLVRPAAAGTAPWPGDDTGPRYRRATSLIDTEIKQDGGAKAATVKDLCSTPTPASCAPW